MEMFDKIIKLYDKIPLVEMLIFYSEHVISMTDELAGDLLIVGGK